ncbi:LacI family DNA-binding transcriptional regulator [Zhihengliuella somnathii]
MAKPRLIDVAEASGVSVSTASKALNGRADISEEVRRKVTKTASEMGYSSPPRVSQRQAPPRLTVVFDHFSSPYAVGILSGAVHASKRAGVELVTTTVVGDSVSHRVLSTAWMRELVAKGSRGLIVVTAPVSDARVRWCQQNRLPLILIDPASPNHEHVVAIGSTNWNGGKQAAEHLLELGHRRIGMVTGPAESIPAGERQQGFRSAMQMAGCAVDEGLVTGTGFTPESGRVAALRMLTRADRPTAIFAVYDVVALGVLRAAEELGLKVPEALSVIGFDDTSAASWMSPPLTTIRQPLASMGQVAVERALALSNDPERFAHPFQLETRLVVRKSTAPPAL